MNEMWVAGVRLGGVLVLSLATAACGGAPPEAAQEPATSSGGSDRDARAEESMNITGLRGVLSPEEIQGALEPKMLKFSRCVQRRSGDIEWLSGGVTFEFRVTTTGTVASVYPRQSSMGDRATEQCMLEVAKATRFPVPRGGEAEFGWSLEVPLDPEVRAPVTWTEAQARDAISQQAQALRETCGGGAFDLTAYVDIDGKVVSVGGAVADEASAEKLECATSAVQQWAFPSPGSYAAKLNFRVD